MKITDLELEQYGIYQNESWKPAAGCLNVIMGENESGKTTLLRFIRDMMFGYERGTFTGGSKDGKIGLSLGCRGDRATGALGYGDVRVTMTTEQLIKALDGCDTVEKNNILYPYNPTCLYKSAF